MKKFLLLAIIFLSGTHLYCSAQDSIISIQKNTPVIYTIGYNKIPENCNLPLIGILNKTVGNHAGLEIGLLNHCGNNFKGFQIGFANGIANNLSGVQTGFLNAVGNDTKGIRVGFFNAVGNTLDGCQIGFINAVGNISTGLEIGFVNATGNEVKGIQAGFVNATGNEIFGLQAGFVNAIGNKMNGVQVGFVNAVGNKVHGLQIGFLNTTGNKFRGAEIGFANLTGNKFSGLQIGFFNKVHSLSGFQLGFLNITDTVAKGIPLGFLTYVKNGGYQVVDIGISNLFPVNISYKTGTERFYTSVIASCGGDADNNVAFGFGLGTLIPVSGKFGFNPEITSQSTLSHSWQHLTSLKFDFNYQLSQKLFVFAGPSLTWNYRNNHGVWLKTFIPGFSTEINGRNRLITGLNAGLGYHF